MLATYRSFPFFTSCLIGFSGSLVAIWGENTDKHHRHRGTDPDPTQVTENHQTTATAMDFLICVEKEKKLTILDHLIPASLFAIVFIRFPELARLEMKQIFQTLKPLGNYLRRMLKYHRDHQRTYFQELYYYKLINSLLLFPKGIIS